MPPTTNIAVKKRKAISSSDAMVAVINTKIENLEQRMDERFSTMERRFDERVDGLEAYLKHDFARTLELRLGNAEEDIRGLKKFRDETLKRLFMAMGGFAVLLFLLEVIVIPIVLKTIIKSG